MEHTTPSVNPNANSRVWVIMMRQCRFIDCNKGPTLVGDIDRRGACVCVRVGGVRAYMGISKLSAHFFCKPKTFLKK